MKTIALVTMAVAMLAIKPGYADAIAFPEAYIRQYEDSREYTVRAGLEMAIILTAVAYQNSTLKYHPLRRKPEYYQQVLDHFAPFANHPVFEALGLDPNSLAGYINLRNSSYRWDLCGGEWCEDEFLGKWWEGDSQDMFAENIDLIMDFSEASGFQEFYTAQHPRYLALGERYREIADMDQMIGWLSRHFDGHYNAYTLLFSPLMLGNQATTRKVGAEFSHVFMIVDPPSMEDDMVRRLNSFKWVFTEIDHQFVNPSTDLYTDRVDEVFNRREIWAAGKQSEGYKDPYRLFNEYMTWAVYIAYVDDHYETDVAEPHTEAVLEFMTERRGFPRFREFVNQLRALRKSEERIAELYPGLLAWAQEFAEAQESP